MALCVDVQLGSLSGPGSYLKLDLSGPIEAVIVPSSQTEITCTTYLLQTAAEVNAQVATITNLSLETIGIDPAQIFYVYTWGAGAVLFMWKFGYAIGAAIDAIKKF